MRQVGRSVGRASLEWRGSLTLQLLLWAKIQGREEGGGNGKKVTQTTAAIIRNGHIFCHSVWHGATS